MAIPDFQSIFMPLLNACADGREHSNRELRQVLAARFELTEADLSVRLPSGKQCVFDNRVAWAKAHLKQSGLLEIVQRGVYRISQRGLEVLGEAPHKLGALAGNKASSIHYQRRVHERGARIRGACESSGCADRWGSTGRINDRL